MSKPDQRRVDWSFDETCAVICGVVKHGHQWSVMRIDPEFKDVFLVNRRSGRQIKGKFNNMLKAQGAIDEQINQGLRPAGSLCCHLQVLLHGPLLSLHLGELVIGDHNHHDSAVVALDFVNRVTVAQEQAAAAAAIHGDAVAPEAVIAAGIHEDVPQAAAGAGIQEDDVAPVVVEQAAAAAVIHEDVVPLAAAGGGHEDVIAPAPEVVEQVHVRGWTQAQTLALLMGVSLNGKKWSIIKKTVAELGDKSVSSIKSKWEGLEKAQRDLDDGVLCSMLQGFPVAEVPIAVVPVGGVRSNAARLAAKFLEWMREPQVANREGNSVDKGSSSICLDLSLGFGPGV